MEKERKRVVNARIKRAESRWSNVFVGKRKVKDAVVEEALEETADWIDRGGPERLWRVIKFIFYLLIVIIFAVVILIFNYAK